ncbi:ATP-dependent Clp protease adapter ClpS [Zophobihabitans entericus]|uniref:ATP-dependent Clp protease adapter protein ClpS n=1 Tax=Zophobihabitans entericus TaxID=1635327 RepID=A0A6G9ICC6_9GAMM|nr:ATP-dependent Clp protease adapter ClpS [Zophobihabitans entericus]QIQ21886.1 ATP-dependent Clp protease adapter ClpS [Zophobihabitans entericus]
MSIQHVIQKQHSDEKQKQLAPPSKYLVVLHNDDYTTMDFVIEVLMKFFGHDETAATQIMFAVHKQGRGICGMYTAEIAETKVQLVTEYAYQHQHPLRCTMEKAS